MGHYSNLSLSLSLYPTHTLLCFDLLTRSKMPFKVMHRKEVTHSNGSYERKSRGRKLADEMGWGKNIPWYSHRLTLRKRLTSELHDSYFRLMTIKHSISKIEWASSWVRRASWIEFRFQLTSTPRGPVELPVEFQTVGVRCGRESRRRLRGPSGTPMEFGVQIRCW